MIKLKYNIFVICYIIFLVFIIKGKNEKKLYFCLSKFLIYKKFNNIAF